MNLTDLHLQHLEDISFRVQTLQIFRSILTVFSLLIHSKAENEINNEFD